METPTATTYAAPGPEGTLRRRVSSWLVIDAQAPATLDLCVTVAARDGLDETLSLVQAGAELAAQEVVGPEGTRVHRVAVGPGRVEVSYQAVVDGWAPPPEVRDHDLVEYLRPSRFVDSDRILGLARTEFSGLAGDALLAAVVSWVAAHMRYDVNETYPTDAASDSLLSGAGVCRDYAHATVGLLRAMEVPARVVAAYAPGLAPMDFHAVAEAYVSGGWRVLDATALAPRQSLVRIATGRDAADTAFLTNYGGDILMVEQTVSAIVDGVLTMDDGLAPVTLG